MPTQTVKPLKTVVSSLGDVLEPSDGRQKEDSINEEKNQKPMGHFR